MKKIFQVSLALAIFAAPALVFAASLAPTQAQGAAVATGYQDLPNMQEYMLKMQTGGLSAQEQKEMYDTMHGGGNVWFSGMPGEFKAVRFGFAGNELHKWFGLACVITLGLIWVILLLIIMALWHHVKKHHTH